MEYGYRLSKAESEGLKNRFEYHPPASHQSDRYLVIRELAKDYARYLLTHCPRSDELKRALEQLDMVVMLANASIARNEPNGSGESIEDKPYLPIDHIFAFMAYLSAYPEPLHTGAMNSSTVLIEPFKKYCEVLGLEKVGHQFHGVEEAEIDYSEEPIESDVIRKLLAGIVLDFVHTEALISKRYFYKEDLQMDDPIKMPKPVVRVTFEYIDADDMDLTVEQRDSYKKRQKSKKTI